MTAPIDEAQRKLLLAAFRMPAIQSRKSSVTNAFITAMLPTISPTVEEIAEALAILGMEAGDVRCAYCCDKMTEWDHLRPLVVKRRPTGFISEIANLVPACGKCNQSKRNEQWRDWMLSAADRSPTKRKIVDVAARIERLEAFVRWRTPTHFDIESVIGRDAWETFWSRCEAVIDEMGECQKVATTIRAQIARTIATRQVGGE